MEHGVPQETFTLKAVPCDGIEACRLALLKESKGVLDGNFIEGMACEGGCVQGAGCTVRSPKNKAEVQKHAKEAADRTIAAAVQGAHDK